MVLKSGTNQLHGDIYEYARNDATNARNPFTSVSSTGQLIKSRQLRFNNFGGTLGGPVVLPHIYNGKDKTFFFFSWDTTILHLIGTQTYTVPTPLMRQGDFSEDPNTAEYGLWDAFTTQGPNAQGLFDRTAFGTPLIANGCQSSVINDPANAGKQTCQFATKLPAGRLDPVAMFYMNSFPMPNYNNPLSSCPLSASGNYQTCNNYLGTIGSSQDPNNISVKIDHQWSDKSKYFGEWLYNPLKYANYRVPWTGATFPWSGTGWGGTYDVQMANQIIAFGNTYAISPSFVNDFRVSYSRQAMTTNPKHPYPDSITDQTQVQQVLAPSQIPEDPYFPIPLMAISTPSGGSLSFGPPNWVNMLTGSEAFTFLDNVTKIIGKHTMKTGFLYRLEHSWYESGYGTNFNFDGDNSVDPILGIGGGAGLEQFMLGAAGSSGRDVTGGLMFSPRLRNRYWGFYWQDDYRVTRSLTIDFGLRYDIYGMFKINQHPMSNFCLNCPNPTTGLPGKIVYEGDPQLPTNHDIFPANKTDFGPRLNFAWTPFADHKTVLRGGYDIFYSNAFQGAISPGQTPSNFPGWSPEYDWNGSWTPGCAALSGQCVSFPLSDTTTNKAGLTVPPRTSGFPAKQRAPLLGFPYLQFLSPVSHDPMVQMWNFQIERELPGNFMASVGYVGNHGTHLLGEPFRNFNQVPTADILKYKSSLYSDVPITNYYSGTTAAALQSVYGSSTLPLSTLLKPWPFYGAVAGLVDATAFDGTTVYNGLNVKVQKRFTHGLQFTAAYTNAKKINNAETATVSGWSSVNPITYSKAGGTGGRAGLLSGLNSANYQNWDDRKVDRAIAPDDISQIFNIAGTYQLPFGVGRAFLNQKGPLNAVLGGWQLSANLNAQTGVPLPISCPGDQITSRCDLIGSPSFSQSRSKADKIADWINPAAFTPAFGADESFWANYNPSDPRAWQYGTMGPRLANFRAPGFWNVDSALEKQFHINEAKYFELRWEAFNALNHQNLGLPNTGFCLPPTASGGTDLVHQAGCSFGRITDIATDPRALEFALKFHW